MPVSRVSPCPVFVSRIASYPFSIPPPSRSLSLELAPFSVNAITYVALARVHRDVFRVRVFMCPRSCFCCRLQSAARRWTRLFCCSTVHPRARVCVKWLRCCQVRLVCGDLWAHVWGACDISCLHLGLKIKLTSSVGISYMSQRKRTRPCTGYPMSRIPSTPNGLGERSSSSRKRETGEPSSSKLQASSSSPAARVRETFPAPVLDVLWVSGPNRVRIGGAFLCLGEGINAID